MDVSIKVDTSSALRGIRSDRDQIPFAVARALTLTAKDAQQRIIQRLPQVFTLRRVSWEKQGVRITKATKQNWTAAVADIHSYMVLQETGGPKIPYGNHLCVPLRGARPVPTALIRKQDFPKVVMDQGGFIKRYRGLLIMFRRIQKGVPRRRGQKLGQIVPMYLLLTRAELKSRFGFAQTVQAVVDGGAFDRNFDTAFRDAVATK